MAVVVDEMECAALQQEEWEVLESIYPDCVSSDLSKGVIKLEIPVELSEPTSLISAEDDPPTATFASLPRLSVLPPLLLDIVLPPTYPTHSAPHILSIHATHSWLPSNMGIQRRLAEMWNAGEGVLYTWVEWIRSGEFLDALELTSTKESLRVLRIPHPELSLLMPYLTAYESSTQMARFSQMSYNCQICLTSIKGARCFLLSCSHVFCRSCLEDFWKLCIAEGDIGRVGCPDPKCVKEGREANEDEVRRVVTEEEIRRWKWLRQKRMLERDPGMVHCPNPSCQNPVPQPPNVDEVEGTGWNRLRTCSHCNYSFCVYCKRTWHGPLTDCPLRATEQFVQEYIALPEGSAERVLIERRYGKANVLRLVAKYEEDAANRKWLEQSTTACPTCRVPVEKSLGCNHMTCAKCGQHFCYRCGDKLASSNPYGHFSTPGLKCFSMLFDTESVDNEWQPVEGFDVL
ncbi:translation termination inhibitor protein itt1 [Steccherinum ochraceum]|uniref:RBR-type E3 ubiquitin transferase n=1 Tax=Steccherinum ochraceum TaxID=92696 RepID=A0A4V2MXG3_9APHY|nr:translation termination inhibitor protein itt1 [Steccherinum ochraceum]